MSLRQNRLKISEILKKPDAGVEALVMGWVRSKRESKAGVAFVEINDGSCFENLQIVVPASWANYGETVPKLYPGTSIRASGKLVASQGGRQAVEMQAEDLQILGESDPLKYPIAKQKMT